MNKSISVKADSKGMCTLLSFVIPAIVLLMGIIALHITPFGNHDLAISDGRFYINGNLFLGRLLRGAENPFYSFKNGLGGNEWSILAWGGFSFGGLLSVLGTLENMPTLFTWICVVNTAICGLTMYVLLAAVNGHKMSNLIFSTSYALIGFNAVNCYQALFFWGPQMLPLVVWGLVRMARGKSPLVYVLSLAFCTFFNFYFAFQLGVASACIVVAYLWAHKEVHGGESKRLFVTWSLSSVVAVLIAAPMWLPALKAYSGGGRLNQTGLAEFSFAENMPFIQIFSKLFSGANSLNELVSGLPNIFCGILVVALVILYFMSDQRDTRRKGAAGVVLVLYLLTFYIQAFTLAMHGGTHTNWFPYRYSYVFSFLLICLAVEEFKHIDELTFRDCKRCGIALVVGVLLVFATRYEFISGGLVLFDLALLLMMGGAFWLYKTKPDTSSKPAFCALLLILVCINLYTNFTVSINKMKDWELDLKEYGQNTFVSGALVDAINMVDDSFFRMEKDKSESDSVGADPYLYGYNGVSHSGPTERMFIHQGLSKLGVNWFDMRHWYSEGIPAATDNLLGLKYLLSDRDLAEEKGYEKLVEIEGTSAYKNSDYLSVASLVDARVQEFELGDDAFANLNSVWKSMAGGERDVFVEVGDVSFTLHNAASEITVTSVELQELKAIEELADKEANEQEAEQESSGTYVEYAFVAPRDGPAYVFDTSIPSSEGGLSAPTIRYCGYHRAGETVTGKLEIKGADYVTGDFMRGYCTNLVFACADAQVLSGYSRQINARDITFAVESETQLTGTFDAGEGERLLFTIPWDEGWQCFVDGVEVPIDKTWDLFMSIEAPVGSHSYEMKFFPAWMGYGLVASGVGAGGLVALVVVWHNRRRRGGIVSASESQVPLQEDASEQEGEDQFLESLGDTGTNEEALAEKP